VLTTDTLHDPRYADAALVLAPGLSGYPLTAPDLEQLVRLPPIAEGRGLLAVRRR
jgi:hypothetical protein